MHQCENAGYACGARDKLSLHVAGARTQIDTINVHVICGIPNYMYSPHKTTFGIFEILKIEILTDFIRFR